MTSYNKLYDKIIKSENYNNIKFSEFQLFLEKTGFQLIRTRGDHYIYALNGLDEIINIQPSGKNAKSYQIKQVRLIINKYKLGGNFDESG